MARSKGEGSITQLGGRYQARITTGYDENGKQKRRAKYFGTKKEAIDWPHQVKEDKACGEIETASQMMFVDWFNIWLTEYKKLSVRPSTYRCYQSAANLWIVPNFAGYRLMDMRHDIVQQYVNNLCEGMLSYSSVMKVFNLLKGALNQAQLNGMIVANPAENAVLPKKGAKRPMRVLTPEEQHRFIEVAQKMHFGECFTLILGTGIRIGEAISLTWDDVDLDNGTISINKTVTSVDTGTGYVYGVGPPKTKAGYRQIPLLDCLVSMLKRKKQAQQPNAEKLLFPGPDGKLCHAINARWWFTKITRQAGITGVGQHTLRHTFATRGLENGIDLKIMQELLGHSSIRMTADTYTHVLPDMKRDSIMKLADTIVLA